MRICFLLLLFFVSPFCAKAQEQNKKLFSLLSPNETGVNFRNDIVEDGNTFFYKYEYLYNGGGVSIGDINNDGLQDIYLSSTMGFNQLYLNLGNLGFKDITAQSGVNGGHGIKTGINMIDINNDGWLDILVCKSGPVNAPGREKFLYINNHDLTFTNRAAEYGLNDASYTTQAYFFDYDKDGDKDVYFVNHPVNFSYATLIPAKMVNGKMVYAGDTTRQYVSNRLYENEKGKFTDVTAKSNLLSHAFGLSAAIYDFNNDNWPDIYVANDFNKPDCIYINNKNGTFTDELTDYFDHTSLSSMGCDINDINNDGHEDLFVADMAIEDPVRQKQLFVQNLNYDKFQLLLRFNLFYQYPRNCLQLNNGNGTFSDIAYYSNTAQTDWSWAPLMADYDNDGWKDLFITNGYMRDVTDWDYKNFVLDSIKNLMAKGQSVNLEDWFKQIPQVKIKNYYYRNNGSLRFENYSDKWCDQTPSFSNSAAYADLDNDGDLDLVVNNIGDPAFIYKNNSRELNKANYLRFRILKNKTSQQEVYGAVVKIYDSKNNLQLQRYDPQRGYMGTMEHFLHFGTGKEASLPFVKVTFPSGKSSVFKNIKTNQLLTIYEDEANDIVSPLQIDKPLFKKNSNKAFFGYTHKENDFIDFKREPLIPYKCSRKGPYYAKADVNGDGKEDIYIGAASGFEGKLMMQMSDGSFKEKTQAAFVADKKFEDGGAVFFDADGDKDNDLYVSSGGAEFDAGSSLYQDRLYINDGKGNFSKKINGLPKEAHNNSFVIAFDYDEDGDKDLFVGGAVTPGKFPLHDKNLVFQNNKGFFKEVSDAIAPALTNSGIVNYATWNDMDGDKKNELIVVGEWMSPMILRFANGRFEATDAVISVNNKSMPLKELNGWWNVVKPDDVDNDGDTDLVVGNRGINSKITAGIDEPCTIYAKDFDSNGSYDAVLGYYIWGKCYPMYHRDQLIDQMPMMRKKFIRYRNYAGKTLDEIFTSEQKKGMDVFKANWFESGVLINDGDFKFRFVAFPEQAQFSTINDLIIADLDGDGNKDILTSGNSYDPDVSTGNYDARAAQLLSGDGKGNFQAVQVTRSGLDVNGEVRRIIYLQDKKQVILLKNNDPAQLFQQN